VLPGQKATELHLAAPKTCYTASTHLPVTPSSLAAKMMVNGCFPAL